MIKLTQRQTDKLFAKLAAATYDKFIESVISVYMELFPETPSLDDVMYDKVRERLMIELQMLYAEARGEKNAKSKLKKAVAAKRAAAK